MSDGAAAVLLARRSVAKRLGLPILGKFVTAATVGVPPKIMGVGPAFAIPRVLEVAGITLQDVDFFEINEAFASQAVFSIQHLKIPFEKVNLNGGAIAIGHPLGCSKSFNECPTRGHRLIVRFHSWCPSSRHWLQHCETDRWKGVCDKHVYWLRNGYGRCIC